MTDTKYQEAVSEARSLVKRSEEDQWRLAQLTWEQLNSGVAGARWAEDIGVHSSYVYRLYKMWESHSHSDQVGRPKFSDAYHEASPSSQYQPPLHSQSAADQAKAVQQALSNPEVASKVFSDQATKTSAIKAIHHDNAQGGSASSIVPPSLTFTKLDVMVFLGEAKDSLRRAFKLGVSLDLAGDGEVISDLGDVLDEGEKFHQYLMGMGLDEAIEKLLEGTGQ